MGLWQKFKDWWYKYTYFNRAIQNGDLEGFKKLIDRYKLGKRLTASGRGLYFCQKALEAKKTDIARYVMNLISTNKKLKVDDLNEILTHATYHNNLEIAKDVFAQGPLPLDIDFLKWLIYEAIKHKSSDVALLLLDKSIKILKAKHIKYLFRQAAYYNDLEVIEDLLKRGAIDLEQNKHFITWLICQAIKKGNSTMAMLLLKSEVEIPALNQKDILSYAVMQNDLMAAENILNRQNKILFESENWILGGLVEHAIIKHQPQMALLILASGAAINPSPNNRSLIGLAYDQNRFDVMAKIIDQGVLIKDKSVWSGYIAPDREKIREAIENDNTLNPEKKLEALFKIRKGLIEWHVAENNLFAEPILRQALKIADSLKRLQTLIELKDIKFTAKQRSLYQEELIKAAQESDNNADKWHQLFELNRSTILDNTSEVKKLLYQMTMKHRWTKKELSGFLQKLSEIYIEGDEQMENIEIFIEERLSVSQKKAKKLS